MSDRNPGVERARTRMKVFRSKPTEMPFLDHLEELRWRLIWSLGTVLLCAILGFVLVQRFDVLGILIEPLARIASFP